MPGFPEIAASAAPGIPPELETQSRIEREFAGVQVREIAGVCVRPRGEPFEKPEWREGDDQFPATRRGADGGQLLHEDQARCSGLTHRENRESGGEMAEHIGSVKWPVVLRLNIQLGAAIDRQQGVRIQRRLLQGRALVLDRGELAFSFDDRFVGRGL